MASIDNIQLINNVSLSGNSVSSVQNTQQGELDYIAMLKLANTSGATVGGTIEHSPDGINWETLATFSALTADGIDSQEISSFVYPKVRANLTVSGGSADVSCFLWFDKRAR